MTATGLAFAVAALAAPAGEWWTKAWAEHVLRTHLRAVSVVCLPLGAATRANGSSTFREFICTFVERDGSRYAIHLRPRSRTTWTTVSSERLGAQPPPAGGAPHAGGQGHKGLTSLDDETAGAGATAAPAQQQPAPPPAARGGRSSTDHGVREPQ